MPHQPLPGTLGRPPIGSSAVQPARTYHVGPRTMEKVFAPFGLTNVSDLQAVLDAVEAALTSA